MRIKSIELKDFKRFTDLRIQNIPSTAKIVLLVGPNGCGKSSLFESFHQWSIFLKNQGWTSDLDYFPKNSKSKSYSPSNNIKIEFHGSASNAPDIKRKYFYIRSAYRNEADFSSNNIGRIASVFDEQPIANLISDDKRVSINYKRIVGRSLDLLYSGQYNEKKVGDLAEEIIGDVRKSVKNVFENLILEGPGNPLEKGSFFFEKGISKRFHYKNLSGGEKAVFDIVLDLILKKVEYDDTIFVIDEPDLHMHTKLQGALLNEIYNLVDDKSQLWISTHSIGMMKKAVELQKKYPNNVVFLDFHDCDPDETVILEPKVVDKKFWKKVLKVALDDISELIVPSTIVVCEGNPSVVVKNKEFDASCLRKIFNYEFPDLEFISVGNDKEVTKEKLDLITTLKSLSSGVKFIKLIDRDDRSDEEIKDLNAIGTKVLSKRDLESYLLDDEVIEKLCLSLSKAEKIAECLKQKEECIERSKSRGNPVDDIKSASGEIYVEIKRVLELTQCGNSKDAFLRDTLSPLITSDMKIYQLLRKEILE